MCRKNIWLISIAILISACSQTEKDTNTKNKTNEPIQRSADGMVLIKGGEFAMGAIDESFADALPIHQVSVNSFWMDEHEVTNKQFEAFVNATQYVTDAEKQLDPRDYPNVPAENLVSGSAVFSPPNHQVSLDNPLNWWRYIPGANWKNTLGDGKKSEPKKPVVHVSYNDALAYANWAGKRLPTEAEWEYAARAGAVSQPYYWGSELKPSGKWLANIFQGRFPDADNKDDGFKGLAPVMSYPANAFGLYDMEGNVWEWCSDFYRPDYYKNSELDNPKGPLDSYDPTEPGVVKKVQRGGSYVCSDEYCNRYKAGSRGKGEISSASNNLGFRCVKDI